MLNFLWNFFNRTVLSHFINLRWFESEFRCFLLQHMNCLEWIERGCIIRLNIIQYKIVICSPKILKRDIPVFPILKKCFPWLLLWILFEFFMVSPPFPYVFVLRWHCHGCIIGEFCSMNTNWNISKCFHVIIHHFSSSLLIDFGFSFPFFLDVVLSKIHILPCIKSF